MRTVLRARTSGAAVLALAMLLLASCAGDGEGDHADIVVTTNVLGDVVRTIVGDDATVSVVMPPASNPHDFAPSPQQAAAMRGAAVLVVNGRRFEAGLVDTIEAAAEDGATVVTATDGLADTDGYGNDADPHFFTDPVAMASVVEHLATELRAEVPALDTDAFAGRVEAFQDELAQLDHDVSALLAAVPAEDRVLVTNHEALGFFAHRYGFEVLGVIVPGGATLAEPSASELHALAGRIAAAGVPAIFAETSSPRRLADALAAEGTEVEVVPLYTESLGKAGTPGATYLGMIRTNAERIAAALAG